MLENFGHAPLQTQKLLLTLQDKKKYIVHYRNLQLYLSLGMRVKEVHRVWESEQECWVKPYIEFNTELRKRQRTTSKKISTS